MDIRRFSSTIVFVLVIAYLNWKQTEFPSFNFESQVEFSKPFSLTNRTIRISNEYPRNITDWYKGSWKIVSNAKGFTSPLLGTSSGLVSLVLNPSTPATDEIKLIRGTLQIREGTFITDKKWIFDVQGFYVRPTGAVFLLANPNESPLSFDYGIVLPDNRSLSIQELISTQIDADLFPDEIAHFEKIIGREIMNNMTTPPSFVKEDDTFGTIMTMQKNDTVEATSLFSKLTKKSLDKCFFQIFLQQRKISELFSVGGSPPKLRKFKYGKASPFDTSTDESVSLFESDDERLSYEMKGFLVSPNCHPLTLQIGGSDNISNGNIHHLQYMKSTDMDDFVSRSSWYIFIVIGLIGIHTYVFIEQTETRSSASALSKISTISLFMQILPEFLMVLIHTVMAIEHAALFHSFIIACFLKKVSFIYFESRYVFEVSSLGARNQTGIVEMMKAYLGFQIAISLLLWTIIAAPSTIWFWVLTFSSFWVPQIIFNARYNVRNGFSHKYIIACSIIKLFYPTYIFGTSKNIMQMKPDLQLVIVAWIWIFLQTIVLLIQDKYGPRTFFPSSFFEEQYNYRRPIPQQVLRNNGGAYPICVICMSQLEEADLHLITPCNHVYHQNCLLKWMDQKLECPTCRRNIPFDPEADVLNAHHNNDGNNV